MNIAELLIIVTLNYITIKQRESVVIVLRVSGITFPLFLYDCRFISQLFLRFGIFCFHYIISINYNYIFLYLDS